MQRGCHDPEHLMLKARSWIRPSVISEAGRARRTHPKNYSTLNYSRLPPDNNHDINLPSYRHPFFRCKNDCVLTGYYTAIMENDKGELVDLLVTSQFLISRLQTSHYHLTTSPTSTSLLPFYLLPPLPPLPLLHKTLIPVPPLASFSPH